MIVRIYLVLFSLFWLSMAEKVPTVEDVDDYNDPVLREVFASSHQVPANAPAVAAAPKSRIPQRQSPSPYIPQPNPQNNAYIPPSYSAAPSPYAYSSPAGYSNPYATPPPSLSAAPYNSPASDLGALAAQGAQTFVQGAVQVGRVFGIQPPAYGGSQYGSQYEVPLGGGFFGK